MIFPIGDDNIIGGYKPIVAYSLIVINIVVFIFQLSQGPYFDSFTSKYGLIPDEIVNGQDLFALITSIFLHGGFLHIIGNMLFLWIFADNIEAIVGSLIFTLFYLGGGLFASFAHIFADMDSMIPTVGASGAISAVMGAYLVMFPKSRIKILFVIKSFHIPALTFLALWFISQLFSGFGNLNPETADEGGGVAWWAHIGGFIYGLVLGKFFRTKYGHRYTYSTISKPLA